MSWTEFWITGASTWTVLLLIYVLTASFRRPKMTEPPRKKTFLEEALEADPERPKPNKTYTWDDLQRDLHDPKLTFEEIHEKCGGIFPEKPEAPKDGPGMKSDDPDRIAKLQAWFKERGEERRIQGLVPPPPAPHTVIHKIYTRGRR